MYRILLTVFYISIVASSSNFCKFEILTDDTFNSTRKIDLLPSTYEKPAANALKYYLSGFAHGGVDVVEIRTNVVHSFSNNLVSAIQQRLFIPDLTSDRRRRELHLLSPGITRLPSGRYLVVSRLWFNQQRRMGHQMENEFSENYLYQQIYSADFQREEVPGTLVPIAAPINFIIGGGPSDPRVFQFGKSIFVNFYMLRNYQTMAGKMFLWDMTESRLYQPTVELFTPATIESNWSPFDFGGHLHYVYMFNPLRILRCELASDQQRLPTSPLLPCRFMFEDEQKGDNNTTQAMFAVRSGNNKPNVGQLRNPNQLILRGGSPLTLYHKSIEPENYYYLTAIHSTVRESDGKRRYNAHFVLLKAAPNARQNLGSMCIVFISRKLIVNDQVFNSTRLVLSDDISDQFIFPVGLVLQDVSNSSQPFADCALVSYHASDDKSFISKFCGLRDLLTPFLTGKATCLSESLTPEKINRHVVDNLI